MNRDQFIEDTKELIEYLWVKFNKEKVYLVGLSWGSELGMYVIDRYPEKELIWFEGSAHFPHFEEPKKFTEIAVRIKEKLKK